MASQVSLAIGSYTLAVLMIEVIPISDTATVKKVERAALVDQILRLARQHGALPRVERERTNGACLLFETASQACTCFIEAQQMAMILACDFKLQAAITLGQVWYTPDPTRTGAPLNEAGHLRKSLGKEPGLSISDEVYRALNENLASEFSSSAPVFHVNREVKTWRRRIGTAGS